VVSLTVILLPRWGIVDVFFNGLVNRLGLYEHRCVDCRSACGTDASPHADEYKKTQDVYKNK